MWSNVAGKWPGSLGLFGLLQIHDRFEHSKLRSRSRDVMNFLAVLTSLRGLAGKHIGKPATRRENWSREVPFEQRIAREGGRTEK